MVELSTAIRLGIFMFTSFVAVALYMDPYEGIDPSLPFGSAIPYTIAVIGGGIFYIFFLAESGVIGLMKGLAGAKALAGAIFFAAIVKATKKLNTDS